MFTTVAILIVTSIACFTVVSSIAGCFEEDIVLTDQERESWDKAWEETERTYVDRTS